MSEYHHFYTHREKGYVHLNNFAGRTKQAVVGIIKFLNDKFPRFIFKMSGSRTEGCWGGQIKVFWNGKKFGGINLRTGKFFVDTKQGLKRGIDDLVACSKDTFPLRYTDITYDYVEICSRFPQNLFPKAVGIMRKFKKNFRMAQTVMLSRELDAIEGISECLLNDVLFSKYRLNLKIYRLYNYDNTQKFNFKRVRGESDLKSPKFEIQIDNPGTLENALQEAVPVMTAFFKILKCEPSSMMCEEDYQLVEWSEEYEKGSQEIIQRISGGSDVRIPMLYGGMLPERIEARRNKILASISRKPRSISEMIEEANASRGTIKTDLDWLEGEGLVEIRGRCGISNYYAIGLSGDGDNIPAIACSKHKSKRESGGEPKTL